MTGSLDRRLNAYRDDLADVTLRGRVEADRFVEGTPYHVTVSIAPLHPAPTREGDLDTEALGGEAVRVFDIRDGWAWCQLNGDGYVGYIPADMLAAGAPARATHKVRALETFAYAEPTARSRRLRSWLFGSRLQAVAEAGDFIELGDGGYVGVRHVEPADTVAPDFVATARAMLGAPYLWGGKSVRGIDCSGLVQLSLLRADISCPRDTDMQAGALPGDLGLTGDVLAELRRGDIVYWPGHVGIMLDETQMIHANGTNMSTTIDPVALVAERSRKDGPVVAAVKRLA